MKNLIWILLFVSLGVEAVDLGCFGQTFEIAEQDLIEKIREKLKILEQSGELEAHQSKIQRKFINKAKTPKTVEGLHKTVDPRTYTHDPSITVPYDIKNHEGIIFAKAGAKINPLETQILSKSLLFIDGMDQEQVDWAMGHKTDKAKVILVQGSPFLLMERYDRQIYFDQGGVIVSKMGISQVPARVSQKGLLLLIEEITLEHQKDED